MKKIITIPDSIVKELKVLAVKNDTNLKNYIEKLISEHHKFSNITELAGIAIEDGQSERPFWNYLMETYKGIKNESFDYFQTSFDSIYDFLEHIRDTCEIMIETFKEIEKEGDLDI